MQRTTIILAVICATLLGCDTKYPDSINFTNNSNEIVWVDSVSGFESDPYCGFLGPGSDKSYMRSMPIPEEVKLIWWFVEDEENPITTTLDLKPIHDAQKKEALMFVFTKDNDWIVSIK